MSIIFWLIFGGLCGWIASRIVKGSGSGILRNIGIGIVGAFLGGFISAIFGHDGVTGFNLQSMFVAVLGAIVLLLILNFRGRKKEVA